MRLKKNQYAEHFRINKQEEVYHHFLENGEEEFNLDHNVLIEFFDIKQRTKPQNLEQMRDIYSTFEYYSQIVQFSADCRETINQIIGETLNEISKQTGRSK